MKHLIKLFFVIVIIALILSLIALKNNGSVEDNDIDIIDDEVQEIIEEETKVQDEFILYVSKIGEGECIYNPDKNNGYRYGPSMILNDDGSIDAWFSRPGNNSTMWDYISYRHMDSDGYWSDEEVVLYPTSGSLDTYSVCDPGVIYFNGYYYLGYTGTNSNDGLRNQIFVARSQEPNGYYEKWDGSGWGGDPQPIITYDGIHWGAGEISFVVQEDQNEMLCYYTWKDENEISMRCSKVDLTEDWPSTIRFKCISYHKELEECSSDVVYYKDKNVYLAFSIGNRMLDNSSLLIHYSFDGKQFHYLDEYKDIVVEYAHNMGISKHKNGCISDDDNINIAYAYSNDNKWGRWKTYIQNISLK